MGGFYGPHLDEVQATFTGISVAGILSLGHKVARKCQRVMSSGGKQVGFGKYSKCAKHTVSGGRKEGRKERRKEGRKGKGGRKEGRKGKGGRRKGKGNGGSEGGRKKGKKEGRKREGWREEGRGREGGPGREGGREEGRKRKEGKKGKIFKCSNCSLEIIQACFLGCKIWQ